MTKKFVHFNWFSVAIIFGQTRTNNVPFLAFSARREPPPTAPASSRRRGQLGLPSVLPLVVVLGRSQHSQRRGKPQQHCRQQPPPPPTAATAAAEGQGVEHTSNRLHCNAGRSKSVLSACKVCVSMLNNTLKNAQKAALA